MSVAGIQHHGFQVRSVRSSAYPPDWHITVPPFEGQIQEARNARVVASLNSLTCDTSWQAYFSFFRLKSIGCRGYVHQYHIERISNLQEGIGLRRPPLP